MSPTSKRIDAIDFVKGVLVIAMVVYHAMNYAGYESQPREHLGFLPTSFIMITGFLIMHVYADRARETSRTVLWRLMVRGGKLLAIFTVLNLVAMMIWRRNHYGIELSLSNFFGSWFEVYVTVDSKGVAFDVLVPIAYTILLSIPILAVRRRWSAAPILLTALIVVACLVLDIRSQSVNSLHFMSAGVIGLWLGGRGLEEIDRATDSAVLLAVLCLGYVAIAMSNSLNYAAQIYMTVVALVLLYSIGKHLDSTRLSVTHVCLLGRYSLLGYIVQILLLQMIRTVDGLDQLVQWRQALLLSILVLMLMWLVVLVVDAGRRQVPIIDRLYRSVFA